jgi:hypothetical protein
MVKSKKTVKGPGIPGIPVNPGIPGIQTNASALDQILMSIQDINMNPYLLGMAYILLNLGGRFMVLSVSPAQEAFLQNIVFRPLLLFAIMFIGTRNLVVAFWLTLVVILVLHYFLNEESDWYLLKDHHVFY